jgi:hypothetical protein
VFGLIIWMFRLTVMMLVLCVWLMWAMIALPVIIIASATGNHATSRSWQRSLRWRHLRL